MRTPYRAALLGYVGLVTTAAIVTAAVSASQVQRPGLPPTVLVLSAALLCQAEWLQVRYRYRDHVDALNLVEAALAPLLLTCSGAQLAVVVTAGMTAAALLRRNAVLKSVFNVANWVLAAAVGLLLDFAAGGGLIGLAVALGAVAAVNQAVFGVVLALTSGSALGDRIGSVRRSVAAGRLIGLLTNVSFGLLLASAVRAEPVLVLLAFPLVGLLHGATRSYAAVRADRLRLAGMHAATSVLVTGTYPQAVLPVFVAEVRRAFEAGGAELAVLGPEGWRVVVDPPGDARTDPARLAALAATGPVRLDVGGAGCLAAPFPAGGTTGLLCLYDRLGMEGFEDGELSVAAALAADVAGFLDRAELHRSLSEERRQLAGIVASSSDGILTLSADGTVHSWNPSLEAITGLAAAVMVGRTGLDRLGARDSRGRAVRFDAWADGRSLPPEVEIRTPTGDTRWLACSYGQAPGPAGGRLVVVARNVTQAHELDRLKDDFLAIVSHELRTPLAPIKGWAKTMLARGAGLRPDQREEGLRAILGQAQRLEQLVLNILVATGNDAGEAAAEPVDVAEVARAAAADVLAVRPARVVEVVVADVAPMVVDGRRPWVVCIVANLLANAVKYSPDHELVVLRLARVGGDVALSVVDRGPGIPPTSRERIFERWERVAGAGTQTGTGLGLYVSRRLADALGGSLSVDSTVGRGSTFTLRLRAAIVPQQRVGAGRAARDG